MTISWPRKFPPHEKSRQAREGKKKLPGAASLESAAAMAPDYYNQNRARVRGRCCGRADDRATRRTCVYYHVAAVNLPEFLAMVIYIVDDTE